MQKQNHIASSSAWPRFSMTDNIVNNNECDSQMSVGEQRTHSQGNLPTGSSKDMVTILHSSHETGPCSSCEKEGRLLSFMTMDPVQSLMPAQRSKRLKECVRQLR